MPKETNERFDAITISQLSKAFDTRLREAVAKLNGVMAEQADALALRTEELSAAQQQMGDLVRENEFLKQELDRRATAAEAASIREIQRLRLTHQAQVEGVFVDLRDLERQLRERLAETVEQAVRLSEAHVELARLSGHCQAMESARDAALENLEKRTSDLSAAQRRIDDLVCEAEQRNREFLDIRLAHQARLDGVSNQLSEAHVELAQLNERYQNAETASANAIESLERRIANITRGIQAREEMLRASVESVRLEAGVEAARSAVQIEFLSQRNATLVEALHLSERTIGRRRSSSAVSLLTVQQKGPLADDVSSLVDWLAWRAEAALALGPSISFEVSAGYLCSDTDFIAAAYNWLFGRQPDASGLEAYGTAIGRGMTKYDLLVDLALSQEGRSRVATLAVMSIAEDEDFIFSAYEVLLGRPADTRGFEHYLGNLVAGKKRAQVLLDMVRSQEARDSRRPLPAALRTIAMLNYPLRGFALRRNKLLRRNNARRWKIWEAGRLASLEGKAQRGWRDAEVKIAAAYDVIRHSTRDRPLRERGEPLPDSGNGAVFGGSQPTEERINIGTGSLERLLEDTAIFRSPSQIIDSIRAEIRDLSLN